MTANKSQIRVSCQDITHHAT